MYTWYTLRSKSVTLKLLYSLDKLIRIYYERPKKMKKKHQQQQHQIKLLEKKKFLPLFIYIYFGFGCFKISSRNVHICFFLLSFVSYTQCWTIFRWTIWKCSTMLNQLVFFHHHHHYHQTHNSIGCDCGFACDKHFPNGNVCHVVCCWWFRNGKNRKTASSIGKLIWFGTKRSGTKPMKEGSRQ